MVGFFHIWNTGAFSFVFENHDETFDGGTFLVWKWNIKKHQLQTVFGIPVRYGLPDCYK